MLLRCYSVILANYKTWATAFLGRQGSFVCNLNVVELRKWDESCRVGHPVIHPFAFLSAHIQWIKPLPLIITGACPLIPGHFQAGSTLCWYSWIGFIQRCRAPRASFWTVLTDWTQVDRACSSSIECYAAAQLESARFISNVEHFTFHFFPLVAIYLGIPLLMFRTGFLNRDLSVWLVWLRLGGVEANVFHYSAAASACEKLLALRVGW